MIYNKLTNLKNLIFINSNNSCFSKHINSLNKNLFVFKHSKDIFSNSLWLEKKRNLNVEEQEILFFKNKYNKNV